MATAAGYNPVITGSIPVDLPICEISYMEANHMKQRRRADIARQTWPRSPVTRVKPNKKGKGSYNRNRKVSGG